MHRVQDILVDRDRDRDRVASHGHGHGHRHGSRKALKLVTAFLIGTNKVSRRKSNCKAIASEGC